jgi:hypothetical protein
MHRRNVENTIPGRQHRHNGAVATVSFDLMQSTGYASKVQGGQGDATFDICGKNFAPRSESYEYFDLGDVLF